jgi:hypothetical protein
VVSPIPGLPAPAPSISFSGLELLKWVGQACTRPHVHDDPERLFALLRYATRIRARGSNPVLHQDLRELDSHKKKVLSDEATPDSLEELKQKIGAALDSLGARTYATLKLPIAGSETESSVLSSITAVLIDAKKTYEVALTKCRGDYAVDASAYNDVLRIAYNFASDAIGFLRLLTSICDMKPILLWCTVGQQFELSESFKSLPWTRSTNKPSLSNYERIIGDARNKAFHRLFPFNKPIDVILPGASLSDVRLRIFSEYTKRKENELTYQDKGMVDLMKEFTITKEHSVPSGFWSRNLSVMGSTVEVFQGVTRALEMLLRIQDS